MKTKTAEYLREIGEFYKSQAILDSIDTSDLKQSDISYIDAISDANNRSSIKVFEVNE